MPVPVTAESSLENVRRDSGNANQESVLDVALTLVLNEIAHQARSMTNATGSAVLLIRGGVSVYRSTSGVTAGDASAYLSECSERADLSWRKGAPHRCNEVETDRRFDLASCRRLGIRSFLIVPVQDDKKSVVAVIQIFSARPDAFSERDLLALQGLGSHIIDHIQAAERTFGSSSKINARASLEVRPVNQAPSPSAQWSTAARLPILHERLNLALGVMILVLAMLLGWTIGRSERESAHQNRGSAEARANNSQPAVRPAEPSGTTVVQVTNQAESSGPLPDAPVVIAKSEPSPPETERKKNPLKSRHPLLSKSTPSSGSPDELVIFESGNQVFPLKSTRSQPYSGGPQSDEHKPGETGTKNKVKETPVSVSEEVAQQHLLNRVEPEYPEYAREQRLQGTVVLTVNVGKDGTVHGLSRVSGESQLALLAAKAVRQWRFSPLVRNGATVSFESQVTLSFELP